MRRKMLIAVTLMCTLLAGGIMTCMLLTGCAKCIDTQYSDVTVTITDEYYRPGYNQVMYINKKPTLIWHGPDYRIDVTYDGNEYSVYGTDVWHAYHERIGDTVTGVLETKTYDDESVKLRITELKEG